MNHVKITVTTDDGLHVDLHRSVGVSSDNLSAVRLALSELSQTAHRALTPRAEVTSNRTGVV